MTSWIGRSVLALSAVASLVHCLPAFAQEANAPPIRQSFDEPGVDLTTGQMRFSLNPIEIGSGSSTMNYVLYWIAGSFKSNYDINMDHNYLVSTPPKSDYFFLWQRFIHEYEGWKIALIYDNAK